MNRREAIALGLNRYFTGKPCKYGHICDRYIRGSCVECDKVSSRRRIEQKREITKKSYYRNWHKRRKCRQENHERIAERDKRYREKNTAKIKVRCDRYREKNREKIRAVISRIYYEGPKNPRGEKQWLKKGRTMLRNVKRALRSSNPHEALQLLSKELTMVSSLQP